MSSSRSRWRLALCWISTALVAGALASCGGSGLARINQSWALQTVNDHLLPDTLAGTEPLIVITSGSAEIDGNANYTFTFTGTSGGTAGTVGSDHGTWTISSSVFLFHSATPGVTSYIAALSASTFRVDLPGQLIGSSNPTENMLFAEIQ